MKAHILCSEIAAHALSPRIARWNAGTSVIPRGATFESVLQDSNTEHLIGKWNELRVASGEGTPRFNNVNRFVARAATAGEGDPQPIAILFCDDRPRALLAGDLVSRENWHGTGPVLKFLPALDCLSVPETGLITDSDPESIRKVIEYIRGILDQGLLHQVFLHNVDVDSTVFSLLNDSVCSRYQVLRTDHVRLRRDLVDPDTGIEIQHNSKKTLAGYRRKRRQLGKLFEQELVMKTVTSPEETDEFVAQAASIVAQTYQAALGIGAQDNSGYRSFVREMAADGFLRGYVLLGDGKPISYVLGDIEFGEFHLWATSFIPEYAKYSPGILLLNEVFDSLIAEGATRFDFGHGDASYKRVLGNAERQEQDLRLYGRTLLPRLAFAVRYSTNQLRSRARSALSKTGYLDAARRYWRHSLSTNSK